MRTTFVGYMSTACTLRYLRVKHEISRVSELYYTYNF